MTVYELIRELVRLPPELKVNIWSEECKGEVCTSTIWQIDHVESHMGQSYIRTKRHFYESF